jgi:NAD(P)-dependent dehydrogenase (short-subunit alcohol dehydrogenase family)
MEADVAERERGNPTARRLDGRVALVTGASRGIGAATSRRLAAAGATVVLVARATDALDALAAEIAAAGGTADVAPADLGDAIAIDSVIDRVAERHGHLDVLVNNAGVMPPATLLDRIDLGVWEATLALNLTAPFLLSRASRRLMGEGAVVVNVGSTAATYPTRGLGAYNVSKAALAMLTRVCALEWARDGIRVVNVTPGKVETEMVQPILDYLTERDLAPNPLGRVASTEEIAELIAFLVSGGSDYITGSTITIDGGELLGVASP